MKLIDKEDIRQEVLPGRIIQSCVGKNAHSQSAKMTMGFARYCEEAGAMEPHHHAEEIVYIVSADGGTVRYGGDKDNLTHTAVLKGGMTLHIPELEWHVFEYEKGGHVEIIFFYGQTENIRPEEILAAK